MGIKILESDNIIRNNKEWSIMHGENAENYSKIGLEYWQKRRGMKLNMMPVSHRPGINKKNKRRTHKIERRFDKLLVKKELCWGKHE